MFSLGNKEAIMNSNAKFTALLNGAQLNIKGFGTFDSAQLVSAVCQRYQAPRYEVMAFTAPTAAELGITTINVPVTFNLKMKSGRNSSEWANDFIINGRPLVLEVLISSTDNSATLVANKIASALTEWGLKFGMADKGLPFTFTNVSGVITMTMKEYYTYFQSLITFKVNNSATDVTVTGIKAFTVTGVSGTGATSATVPVADTTGLYVGAKVTVDALLSNAGATNTGIITAMTINTNIVLDHSITWTTGEAIFLYSSALEPVFSGKYLEENARMSLEDTNGAYSISPDERPMISGNYASISFIMNDATSGGIGGSYVKHTFLGSTRGEVGGTRQFKFTLYVLEGSDTWTATTGNVDIIVEWLDSVLAAGTTLKLYLADGTNAANSNAFIA